MREFKNVCGNHEGYEVMRLKKRTFSRKGYKTSGFAN